MIEGFWIDKQAYYDLRVCVAFDELMVWPHNSGVASELLGRAVPVHFKVQSDEDAANQQIEWLGR